MKNLTIIGIALFALTPFAALAIGSSGNDGVETKVTGISEEVSTKGGVKIENTKEHEMMEGEMMEDGMMDDDEDGDAKGMERAEMMADEHAAFGLETAKMHIDVHALMKEESEPGHGSGEEEIDMPGKVRSSADFEHFVAHKAKEDARIKDVEIKDGKVHVRYEESAKLFGFIGTTINARASADAEGNVNVAYPWYHIFMKKHVSQASLQSAMARAMAGAGKAEKEGIASTTAQATIATALGIPNIFELIADTFKEVSE